MNSPIITKKDILSTVILANPKVLSVLERMDVKLGVGKQSIEDIATIHQINPDAFALIINIYNNKNYYLQLDEKFEYLPDILQYLKKSHAYFIEVKIPSIHRNIQQLVLQHTDPKAAMVELFFRKYSNDVTHHMNYENNTVFPYIEMLLAASLQKDSPFLPKEFRIDIYKDDHSNIEDALLDLKHILIQHLPQEEGALRFSTLQQLFELESDLRSHSRIENEVIIPLAKGLEIQLNQTQKNR